MTDLPRSRALVRLDGPGHILPIEPVTPPGSSVWRVVHFPLILVMVAFGLLALAEAGTMLLSHGFTQIGVFRGARLIAAALSAAVVVAVYWVFVRFVERRREVVEFGADGSLKELGISFGGGLLLVAGIFAIIALLGGVSIRGYNAPTVLLLPLVSAISAAFVQEIILRGLFFRLIERLAGSWIALAVTSAVFWVAHLLSGDASIFTGLAIVLEAGLTLAAVYMVTRRLWAAIGLHAGFNFAQVGLFGMATPGMAHDGLVQAQFGGPDWLTGGGYGPAASLPAILVNTLFVVVLLGIAVRRGRIVRPIWRQRRTV